MCNRELIEIDYWFRANKLTANINKTSKYIISCASKNVINYDFKIRMGETNLERVKSLKYPGVMLDEQLSWDCHIEYIRKKLASVTGVIFKLKYHVDVRILINIYHALFKSQFQYAIVSWGSANYTALQSLRVLQNRVLRYISRAPLFTRMDNTYLNYWLLKLEDLYQYELGKFMHHIIMLYQTPSQICFQELSQTRQRVTRTSVRED